MSTVALVFAVAVAVIAAFFVALFGIVYVAGRTGRRQQLRGMGQRPA